MRLYIDPGTGSMLFAILIGIIGALNYLLKSWIVKLRFILSGGKKVEGDTEKLPFIIFSDDKRYWNVFEPVCRELNRAVWASARTKELYTPYILHRQRQRRRRGDNTKLRPRPTDIPLVDEKGSPETIRFLARFWVLFPRGKSAPPEAGQADSTAIPPQKNRAGLRTPCSVHLMLQVKILNPSTTMPRTTSTIPVARLSVFGAALFANTAAIRAQRSVNTTHSASTVQSGAPPMAK